MFNWAKKRIATANQSDPVLPTPENNHEKNHKKANHSEAPHRLGLNTADVEEVVKDERTLSVVEEGVTKPVLVPIDQLYWYNEKYLSEHFGTDKIYYYAHPEIADKELEAKAYGYIKEVISNNGVVLYDTVTAGDTVYGDLDKELNDQGMAHHKAEVSKAGKKSWLAQYEGKFTVRKHPDAKFANESSVFEVYEQSVKNGEIKYDPQTGPALLDVVEGDEAERLWKIYEGPFEKLTATHPVNGGYKKDEFMEMLSDPSTLKVVYRDNGTITTLAFFVNNLDHCDWLDKEYYQKTYPEAMETNNVYVFPGIVTDEMKRGSAYSIPMIGLLAKVQALRKTPAIIAFECTEVSSKYVPKIVKFAINSGGSAKIEGISQDQMKSRLDYYAIAAA